MKSISANISIISTLLLNLTACSVIGGYFPDKEKDYQFSSELPSLKVPADISNKGLTKRLPDKQAEDRETVAVIGEVVNEDPTAAGNNAALNSTQEPQKSEPTRVELVNFNNGETRLQINKSMAMSWRMIGKALTGKGIEITARDQTNGEFAVQYDPNETDLKDGSFLDELTFVFGEDHSQEKPYRIKLLARDKNTEAVILDEHNKPISDGNGLSLLKLLATALKADVEDKQD